MDWVVLGHVLRIEHFIPEILSQVHLFRREVAHPDSLHFMVQFSVQRRTDRTSKNPKIRHDIRGSLTLYTLPTLCPQSTHFLLSGSLRSLSKVSASFLFMFLNLFEIFN